MVEDVPRRGALGRRQLVRGAAWTAPVIIVGAAAPVASASPCPPVGYTLVWGTTTYTHTSTSGTATLTSAGGPTITMRVTTSYSGDISSMSGQPPGFNTLDVYPVGGGQVGGTGSPGLNLKQMADGVSGRVASGQGTYTFSFLIGVAPVSVSNLKLTIADIDASSRQYWDTVTLTSSASWSATLPAGGTLNGNGTSTPWAGVSSTAGFNEDTDARGNVAVGFTSPVSTFSIGYGNKQSNLSSAGRNQQAVFVSGMTFSYTATTC